MDFADLFMVFCTNDQEMKITKGMPLSNIALLFNGEQVSTESIHLYDEIKELLQNPVHETFQENSEHISLYAEAMNSDYEMAVTGMADCSDYRAFLLVTMIPFVQKYPEIFEYFDYNYVSMSTPTEYHVYNASSKHGQREVYHDAVLLCANRYSNRFAYFTFLECYENNWFDVSSCLGAFYSVSISTNI